jgi:hypothetical protein
MLSVFSLCQAAIDDGHLVERQASILELPIAPSKVQIDLLNRSLSLLLLELYEVHLHLHAEVWYLEKGELSGEHGIHGNLCALPTGVIERKNSRATSILVAAGIT